MDSFCECERIAELIGAILGDGNVYDKKPSYVEFCGNPVTDLGYFRDVLLSIVREELNKNPRLFVRSRGLRFRINSKPFVDWLKAKGIPAGQAKGYATIPNFIAFDRKLLTSCVRGLFDTDGSVYFDRRAVYVRPYPRIELHMRNTALLVQVTRFLNKIEIKHCFVKGKNAIETAGTDALKQFLKKIGFSNAYHISRIEKKYPELIEFNCSPLAQQIEYSTRVSKFTVSMF